MSHLSIHPSIHPSTIYLLPTHPLIYHSSSHHPSTHPYTHHSQILHSLAPYPFIYYPKLTIHLWVCQSFIQHPSIHPSANLPVHPSPLFQINYWYLRTHDGVALIPGLRKLSDKWDTYSGIRHRAGQSGVPSVMMKQVSLAGVDYESQYWFWIPGFDFYPSGYLLYKLKSVVSISRFYFSQL